MISPGRYHEQVPVDPVENDLYRHWLLDQAEQSVEVQDTLLEMCRDDIQFYINVFVYQFNVKCIGSEVGPFILWPFQVQAVRTILDHWWEQRDLLIEKSREMGASWLCLIVQDWCCLFHGWQKFLDISHREESVIAADDSDSLFWKLNFMHENLPDWMSRGIRRKKSVFHYPATKSAITGSSTTERSGVGGRGKVFLDEFSKQRNDYEILGQTADTGPRVFNGTHYGMGTAFHALTQRPDLHKLVMHWSEHPHKSPGLYRYDVETARVEVLDSTYKYPEDFKFVMDGTPTGGPFPGLRSPWYDAECIRRANSRDVAMHLDIDVKGSVSQFFDPFVIQRLIRKSWNWLWEGDLHHDRDSGHPVALVSRAGGPLRLWIDPTADGRVAKAKYAMGVDVAHGMGATPSCLSIGRGATGEKIGEYVNPHIRPEAFGVLAVALGRLFADEGGREAYLCWEQQGPGEKFGQTVLELRYTNLHYHVNVFDGTTSSKPGWYPSAKAKRLLFDNYSAGLTLGQFTNPSERGLNQTLEYEFDPVTGNVLHSKEKTVDDPAEGRVNHGDISTADALLCMVMVPMMSVRKREEAAAVPFMSYLWRRQQRQKASRDEFDNVWAG